MTDNESNNNEFIVTTASHCYISRQAELQQAQHIELRGRSVLHDGAVLQGHLAPIRIGRFTHIQSHTTITPPSLTLSSSEQQQSYVPVSIGSHTWIGTRVQSHAAAIGSFCWIGDKVRLGERVLLKDAVIVQDGATVPADTVVPPFTYIQTNGEWHELPPAVTVELQERSKQYYHDFATTQKPCMKKGSITVIHEYSE